MLKLRFRRITLFLAALLAALAAQPAVGSYIETFASGNAGWLDATVNNGGAVAVSLAGWGSITPGLQGFATGHVGNGGNRLFGMQPADTHLYGSLTGLTMQADYRIEGQVDGPATPMVRFYVGSFSGGRNDYFVSSDAFSWNPNTAAGWSRHSVPLSAGNFIEWPNAAAHSRTFEQVIAAPEDIGLVFTGSSNLFGNSQSLGFRSDHGATISLTNFGAAHAAFTALPEPVTFILLTIGAGVGMHRRRHDRAAADEQKESAYATPLRR